MVGFRVGVLEHFRIHPIPPRRQAFLIKRINYRLAIDHGFADTSISAFHPKAVVRRANISVPRIAAFGQEQPFEFGIVGLISGTMST